MRCKAGSMHLRSVSRPTVRVKRAARQGPAHRYRVTKRRHGEARIDAAADRAPRHATRPGIEDQRGAGEATGDRDVGQVGHPNPIRTIDPFDGKIGPS